MKQHGDGPLEAWRGVSPGLCFLTLNFSWALTQKAAEPALLGPALAQLLGEPR